MFRISYWILPLFAAGTWFGTLLAMMIVWLAESKPQYSSMDANQRIAYISDIGAQGLKPLFIAGSAVTVVVFDLTFISERWLRHKGRLAHNTSKVQKFLSICAIFFAIVGAAGLILLTCYDTLRHPDLHNAFLAVFIAGYVVSAIFICAEYQRLGVVFRSYRILAISFWIKLVFIFVEVILAIAFGVLQKKKHYNTAAVLEWVIALIYILFVASFILDFLPAMHTKHDRFPTLEEMHAAMEEGNGPSYSGGPTYTDNHSVHSGQPMMHTANGEPATQPPRRF